MCGNILAILLNWVNISVCILIAWSVRAQTWQWTELSPMPFPTSNNAVSEAVINGQEYVYSFGGIDTTKLYSGIHKRCFRYDVSGDSWSEMDTLPTSLSRIAMGASTVKNKIYVIGGYHVYANSNEVSSDEVHIYNPETNQFEAQGTAAPYPIDDHVQCVWRDSLIFVVTGWSNNGNVPYVQIYDPALDSWQTGTSTPNTAFFTAFGASGYILGDTLYYHGGASGGSFGARKYMRKGLINPQNPTDITWIQIPDAPGDAGYRAACSGTDNTVFWLGGSAVSYNYNGIAYNGSGGVNPSARALHFNHLNYQYADEVSQPYGVMDLRGIAKFPGNRWIICGGMDSSQVVKPRTFLLENQSLEIEEEVPSGFQIHYDEFGIWIFTPVPVAAVLYDNSGRKVERFPADESFRIDFGQYRPGVYYFQQNGQCLKVALY